MTFNKGLTENTFEVYLNSEYDRRNGDTTSDWTTEFNNIMLDPNKGYQVALSAVQIPNSCPQFHNSEKHFKIGDGIDFYDVYYDNSKIFSNIPDMLAYVSSLMNDKISGIVISQDADSRKTKVMNNTGSDLVLNFTHSGSINFFRKLGIVYNENVIIANNTSIISSYYPSLIGTSRFYIICEEIVNNSFSGKNYNNWSIMKSINVNVGFGSYVNFQSNNELYYHDLSISTNLNNLSFRILDDRFRPVDLNGGGVNMSLFVREI